MITFIYAVAVFITVIALLSLVMPISGPQPFMQWAVIAWILIHTAREL